MKSKNLLNLKNYLLHTAIWPLLVVVMVLVASSNVSAQKYEVLSKESQIDQTTEISLSGSTTGKFYYLFFVDENDNYSYLRAQIGVGVPVKFGTDFTKEGTYVVFEFDEFKGVPFDMDSYNPADGVEQNGEIIIVKS